MEFSFVSDPLKEAYVLRLITEPLQIKHDVEYCQFYYCLLVSGDRPNAKVEMLFSMSWLRYLPYHCWLLPIINNQLAGLLIIVCLYLKCWHSIIADLAHVIIRQRKCQQYTDLYEFKTRGPVVL